jgi:formylglycine-generating enzyme required for sulfatase activity
MKILAQRLASFLQSLPRWIWLGGGMVLILVLAFWGGNALIERGAKELPELITDDFGVLMALIPAGPFQMGSEDGSYNEQPVHTVTLDEFNIDQYEVTNARYAECVDAGVCVPPSDSSSYTRSIYYGNPEYANHPVIYVSWQDAQTYCQWRKARLPTEAEWEKAARGGLEDTMYPWGDEAPDCSRANFDYDDDCYGDTSPVGLYAPNGYSLYDMAGNAWEWTSDWYARDYYANSPEKNPQGPEDGGYRVLRGGSWGSDAHLLRVAFRFYLGPGSRAYDIGFRCARSP